jgi:hypothetical protein
VDRTPPKEIIGKTIIGVVIKYIEPGKNPNAIMHLIFSDDTQLEVCSPDGSLRFSSRAEDGWAFAHRYLLDVMKIYYESYLDPQGEIVEKTYSIPSNFYYHS